ncbi:MAG: proline--tRNA ligase [Candidatus Woesearchaeota archaeon]|nr:proline--tRNA ligase [Candidatus Woesearchaeota archaeon]
MAKDDTKGISVKKDQNFSEWYSQVVQKADLADIRFGIQGFIVHKPWGFMIIRKIYDYLEKEVELQGHLPYLFPIAVKESDLKKEKEHAGFSPEVFWVESAGSKKMEERFALKPTGEAQIYPIYSLWFRSYNELPFRGYQSRISVYRNEMTTRPFLRGREFCFFETHDVFNTHEEAMAQIKDDLRTCEEVIWKKLKIPFEYFKRPDWDKFKGADATYTPDTLMPDGKRNQLASTHDLGTNFAKAYDIQVLGKDEQKHYVYQTCFGPGIWRSMAALIGIHGDDQGLVVPFDMAPIQIVIVPVTFADKKEATEKIITLGQHLATQLQKAGYRVKFDNGPDSPGVKYNHWELHGVPLRIELGPKEVEQQVCSIARRTERKRSQVALADVEKEVKRQADAVDMDIEKRALTYFKNNIRSAENLEDLKKVLREHRGFVKIPYCHMSKQGEACSDKLQKETEGAVVCGTLYPQEEKVKTGQKCVLCSQSAHHLVYVAKTY